jgi:hypothetical protein
MNTNVFQGEQHEALKQILDRYPTGHHWWCLHLIVMVEFECSWDPESFAGGSVATGRGTHAGQVKG